MQRRLPPPRANEALPARVLAGGYSWCSTNTSGGASLGEEAGEMRRQRPARPRVKLNRDAVWALLDELGISQNELARRCGLSPGYLSLLMAGKRSPVIGGGKVGHVGG